MFLDGKGLRIFVYREPIDMRCGFESLHSYCVHQMQTVMDQGHVCPFFGKNRKRMKLLVYDGSGLVLIAKRIERGSFMSLGELMGQNEITHDELMLAVIEKSNDDKHKQSLITKRPLMVQIKTIVAL